MAAELQTTSALSAGMLPDFETCIDGPPRVLIHSEPGASSGPQYSRTPTLRTTGYHLPNADHSAASQDHHVTVNDPVAHRPASSCRVLVLRSLGAASSER